MKSSAAERIRPTLPDGLIVLAVLAGAALLLWIFRPTGGNFLTATVVLDNVTVAEYDLSTVAEDFTFDVSGAEYPIALEIGHNRIRIQHSDCPSQDCVRTGWVSRSGGQIVCLPNKLVISVKGSQAPEVDGVVG
ncbi:MAG: NusG domain II-containing protein [Clostridia bacterium]|nr:NusG domain II-containing protein [Clostridia bacterium]